MSSKFWLSGNADSSSSSSDSEDVSTSRSSDESDTGGKKKPAATNWNDFSSDDSSSDEESKRIVRSEKDKKWDAIRSLASRMTQNQRVQNYVGLLDDFDDMLKLVNKAQALLEQEGPPHFLIRALVQLEKYVQDKHADKAELKRASKQKATAINRLSRALPKDTEAFREQMELCRENPGDFASEASEASDDEDEKPRAKKGRKPSSSEESSDEASSSSGEESDDESSDSESDSDDSDEESDSDEVSSSSSSESESESSSSSSESESDVASSESEGDFESRHARAMRKWGLKTTTIDEAAKKEAKRLAATKRREDAEKRKAARDRVREEATEGAEAAAAGARRLSLLPETLDAAGLMAKLKEVTADRNKRGLDRQEQLALLRRLAELARQKDFSQVEVDILGFLATFGLDSIQAGGGLHPSCAAWGAVARDVFDLMCLLVSKPELSLQLGSEGEAASLGSTASMVVSFVDRLDDHLNRALQACDSHAPEYLDRLVQEMDIIALLWLAWAWLAPTQLPESWRSALRLVEHLYFVHDRLSTQRWALIAKKLSDRVPAAFQMSTERPPSSGVVEFLCREIFARAPATETRVLFRTQVCLAYSFALHDEYFRARDILAGGHLYDVALSLDVADQALFNRGLAQVGLAAFRRGLIQQASAALNDLCSANKHRELLAQGVSVVKGFEKTVEQEKAERRRLLPAHLHINLDLLESAFNICAMLLEVPAMASPLEGGRHRLTRFKRGLELYEKTSVLPESSREVVMSAALALQVGQWQKCENHIFSLKCWQFIQPEAKRQEVQSIISEKIKAAALRSFVLRYGHRYQSVGVEQLEALFDLPRASVYSLVSKMMIRHELPAFWDAESQAVLITKITPTRLQMAALNIADSVSQSVDQLEQIFPAPSQATRRPQRTR